MDYKIKKCVSKEEVSQLEDYYNNLSIEEKEDLIFDFTRFDDSINYYKVEVNDEIIGIGSAEVDLFNFDDLKRFIDSEKRSCKIGEALLDFIIQDARDNNKKELRGIIKNGNIKGKTFFEKKGFRFMPSFYDTSIIRFGL